MIELKERIFRRSNYVIRLNARMSIFILNGGIK